MKPCNEFCLQEVFCNQRNTNVSLFLNLKHNDKEFNRSVLKRYIIEIEQKLLKLKVPSGKLDSILSPFYAFYVMDDYHSHGAIGILGNEHFFECYRLMGHIVEFSNVGKDFVVTPFFEKQMNEMEKWLLSIGNNKARLFKIMPHNVSEINVFADFPKYKFSQDNLSKIGMTFNLSYRTNKEFIKSISKALPRYYNSSSELLLAGNRELVELFIGENPEFKESQYLPILMDFENSTDIENILLQKVKLYDSIEDSLEVLSKKLDEGYVQKKLEYIIDDCHRGKISDLYIKKNVYEWGEIDDTTGRYKIYPKRNKNAIDIINNLAIKTVLKGGKVNLIPNNHSLYYTEPKVYAVY